MPEIPEEPEGPEVPKEPTMGEHVVGFSAVAVEGGSAAASRITRSVGDGEFTTTELQASGFGVYCWYTGTSDFKTPSEATYMLMQNQKVEYIDSKWTYSPSKYWPLAENEKLTLRAYAPYVSYNLINTIVEESDDYKSGMPLLPVVVSNTDYHEGKQHDPLWGTGAASHTHDSDPYLPDDAVYGPLYDDETYVKSGDNSTKDSHDGIIHWYFHHGMSSLMFYVSIAENPGCEKVRIRSITVTPLYDKGLLDISSPAESSSDKPYWYDRSPAVPDGMTVTLKEEDEGSGYTPSDFAPIASEYSGNAEYASTPFTIATNPSADTATDFIPLLSNGLLIIPREYSDVAPLTVTVSYTIDDETTPLTAVGKIETPLKGNTSYAIKLKLEPSTKSIDIEVVWAAFTSWTSVEGDTKEHTVFNW
jgi:hypothetical protein